MLSARATVGRSANPDNHGNRQEALTLNILGIGLRRGPRGAGLEENAAVGLLRVAGFGSRLANQASPDSRPLVASRLLKMAAPDPFSLRMVPPGPLVDSAPASRALGS